MGSPIGEPIRHKYYIYLGNGGGGGGEGGGVPGAGGAGGLPGGGGGSSPGLGGFGQPLGTGGGGGNGIVTELPFFFDFFWAWAVSTKPILSIATIKLNITVFIKN